MKTIAILTSLLVGIYAQAADYCVATMKDGGKGFQSYYRIHCDDGEITKTKMSWFSVKKTKKRLATEMYDVRDAVAEVELSDDWAVLFFMNDDTEVTLNSDYCTAYYSYHNSVMRYSITCPQKDTELFKEFDDIQIRPDIKVSDTLSGKSSAIVNKNREYLSNRLVERMDRAGYKKVLRLNRENYYDKLAPIFIFAAK